MPIKLTEGNEDQSLKIAPCVYTRPFKIKEIKDKSNYPGKDTHNTIGTKGHEPELCLELTLQDDRFDNDKILFLFGKFKRDKISTRVKGWDTFNNNVNRFLVRMTDGEMEINDDFSIPDFILNSFIGKEVFVTSYLSTKTYINKEGNVVNSWQNWGRIHKPDTDIEQIRIEWNANVQYIKDYDSAFAVEYSKKKEKEKEDVSPDMEDPEISNDVPF